MGSLRSTESLLELFTMFGHPGISALEYAGHVEAKKKQSTSMSEVSLKRKSTTTTHDENPATTAGAGPGAYELSPPIHSIDEFGCQQRKRGTFLNHTPRDFEMRTTKVVDVYRPSRAESENYSRPLSRQDSQADTSPVITNRRGKSTPTNPSAMEKRLAINRSVPDELAPTGISSTSSPDVYMPSTKVQRRSASAPLGKILTYQPSVTSPAGGPGKISSLRSTSTTSYQPQETKRQRRQTPFKITTPPKPRDGPSYTPLEPWVAKHRRRGTDEDVGDVPFGPNHPATLHRSECRRERTDEHVGDVPFDMNREVSAEIGTFGVIQRYFDSQSGGPVSTPKFNGPTQTSGQRASDLCVDEGQFPSSCSCPESPIKSTTLHQSNPILHKPFKEPIAIYPIDELEPPNDPPPVPERSPKRLTNPIFPLHTKSTMSVDSDFRCAAEGQYTPRDESDDVLHVPKKRDQKRLNVGEAAQAGWVKPGKMAPPILGHHALTANSNLGLNDLSYYLKHTGPSPEPQLMSKQRKKKGMKLFKVKQRKTLAARVGSVEGSPQRARKQPAVPSCAREMTTSSGSRHLKIIIPSDTPSGSPVSKSRAQRRSRHISITFTEEMINPLASSDVERLLSDFGRPDTPTRSFSTPAPISPRSPKRSPKPVPVVDHPLATHSRDEQTRARKLRDLQRIKRKPVPGSLPTPAHTPEPESSVEDASSVSRLQDRVVALQRQNTQLTEALAKIVGLDLGDGEVNSEDVLKVARLVGKSGAE
jgi:hypothetical protein